MNKSEKKKFVDVDHLFKSKNPKLYKWIPSLVMNYLKKVIHQEELNQFMDEHIHEDALTFCQSIRTYLDIKVEISGLENIPKEGGVILAANHPLGGLDAVGLVPDLFSVRSDIQIIVNDLLLHLLPLKTIFTGVNKHGRNSHNSLKNVDELFGASKAIFLFPSGLVSRKFDGKVKDLPWKKTFVTRAKKYNSTVLPVYVEGNVSEFFYRMYHFRKAIGIKANIEMFWLVNEMYKQKGKTIKAIVGKPIPSSTFTREKTDQQWTNWVRDIVYSFEKS